jgi:hypothetical protein
VVGIFGDDDMRHESLGWNAGGAHGTSGLGTSSNSMGDWKLLALLFLTAVVWCIPDCDEREMPAQSLKYVAPSLLPAAVF